MMDVNAALLLLEALLADLWRSVDDGRVKARQQLLLLLLHESIMESIVVVEMIRILCN